MRCIMQYEIWYSKKRSDADYHDFEPPTKIIMLIAVHLCPAALKPEPTRASRVASMLASGITTAWFLAPAFV